MAQLSDLLKIPRDDVAFEYSNKLRDFYLSNAGMKKNNNALDLKDERAQRVMTEAFNVMRIVKGL